MAQTVMKPTVYIETSVISYLVARPSRDVVVAADQQVTREWWRGAPGRSNLVASAPVVSEVREGDPDAARARLEALEGLVLLDAIAEAETLTLKLLGSGSMPPTAAEDDAHIAIAATNGVEYLVTWNFRGYCQCCHAFAN